MCDVDDGHKSISFGFRIIYFDVNNEKEMARKIGVLFVFALSLSSIIAKRISKPKKLEKYRSERYIYLFMSCSSCISANEKKKEM